MLASQGRAAPNATPFHLPVSAVVCAWLVGMSTGCTSPGKPLIESPLSVDEQQQAVLKVVPRGTPRDEAARRLKAAGIDFNVGVNQSIFYLSLWNRPNGERWHINVALLFDPTGILYDTRTADSATGLATREQSSGWRRTQPANAVAPDRPSDDTLTSGSGDDGSARIPFPGREGTSQNSRP